QMDAATEQSQDDQSEAQADRGGDWPAVQRGLVAGAHGSLPCRGLGPKVKARASCGASNSARQSQKGGHHRQKPNGAAPRQTPRFGTMNTAKDQKEERMSFSLWP